jgi:FdhD protein
VEEPLEIRVADELVAVVMRSPGDDERLALGFLHAEGIVRAIPDVGRVYHCGRPGDEGYGNVIDVTPGPGVSLDVDRVQASRRGTLTVSACGICGRRSIQDLAERCPPLDPGPKVTSDLLLRLCDQLPEMQPTFRATGGAHAAAAYTSSGDLLCCLEDVARHNAVDKVVGELLLTGRIGPSDDEPAPLKPSILAVSGRLSFEIVQKAAVARIPIVASVSAASSLGADLARQLNVTLVGFVRDRSFNIYTSPERIV